MKEFEVSYDPEVVQSFMDGLNIELQSEHADFQGKYSEDEIQAAHNSRVKAQFNLIGQWREAARKAPLKVSYINEVTHQAMVKGPVNFLNWLQRTAQGQPAAEAPQEDK